MLYQGKKIRRRKSVQRRFVGDYLNIADDLRIQNMMKKRGDKKVIFTDHVDKINRRYKTQLRVLLLTDSHLYNLMVGKLRMKRTIKIADIGGVSLSPKADNYLVVHVPNEYDYLFCCERKTEFLSALSDCFMTLKNSQLPLNFAEEITYTVKRGTNHKVTYVDAAGAEFEQMHAKGAKNELIVSVNITGTQVASQAMIDMLRPHKMKKGTKKPKRLLAGIDDDTASKPKIGMVQGGLKDYSVANSNLTPTAAPSSTSSVSWAKATHDYAGQGPEELSFSKGAVIKILSQDEDGWWSGEINGQHGYVPNTYLKLVDSPS